MYEVSEPGQGEERLGFLRHYDREMAQRPSVEKCQQK